MGKGTAAKGKASGKKNHIICRRCGKQSYNFAKKACSSCGYGRSARQRPSSASRAK